MRRSSPALTRRCSVLSMVERFPRSTKSPGVQTSSELDVIRLMTWDLRSEPWSAFFMSEDRSEEHSSELQSLMRISYAVFCLKKKNTKRSSYNTTELRNHITYRQNNAMNLNIRFTDPYTTSYSTLNSHLQPYPSNI